MVFQKKNTSFLLWDGNHQQFVGRLPKYPHLGTDFISWIICQEGEHEEVGGLWEVPVADVVVEIAWWSSPLKLMAFLLI